MCVFLLGVMGLLQHPCKGITVTVDPVLGSDTACTPIQELAGNDSLIDSTPCRTLNGALGSEGVPCRNISCAQGAVHEFTTEAVVRLADGEHTLTGELALHGVQCGCVPSPIQSVWELLQVRTSDLKR